MRQQTRKSRTTPDRQLLSPNERRASAPGRPTEEDIRRRAYEIYLSRDGDECCAEEDWLRAERELTLSTVES